jgi:hypothetical protein
MVRMVDGFRRSTNLNQSSTIVFKTAVAKIHVCLRMFIYIYVDIHSHVDVHVRVCIDMDMDVDTFIPRATPSSSNTVVQEVL